MKKNKWALFLIISLISVMLVGCKKEEAVVTVEVEEEEENMFGLTEDEQKMYAEYAAGVLMKYNAGSNMRVLEGQTLRNQEAKEEAAREQAARREQLAAEYASNKNSNSKKENQSSGGNSSETAQGTSYISDMATATGTNAFTITYAGYEVADSYPNSGDDILMVIDAGQGKLLLITKFLVTNVSGQTESLDMFSKQAKFKVNVNGINYKSQYTLLLDDLSMYKGEVDAGSTIETVLVFELPETVATDVNDMELSITVDGAVNNMQLRGGSAMRTETAESVGFEMEDMNASEDSALAEEEFDITETENEVQSEEGGNVTIVESNSN